MWTVPPPPPPSSVGRRPSTAQRGRHAESHHHRHPDASSSSSSSARTDARERPPTTTAVVARRPLASTRGANESANESASGGGYAFDRRNSRDVAVVVRGKGGERRAVFVVPPTRSDVALLAMLDGKATTTSSSKMKAKKRDAMDGNAACGRGGAGRGNVVRRDKRRRGTIGAAIWNDANDDDDDDDELVVLMPPPPPPIPPPPPPLHLSSSRLPRSRYRPPPPSSSSTGGIDVRDYRGGRGTGTAMAGRRADDGTIAGSNVAGVAFSSSSSLSSRRSDAPADAFGCASGDGKGSRRGRKEEEDGDDLPLPPPPDDDAHGSGRGSFRGEGYDGALRHRVVGSTDIVADPDAPSMALPLMTLGGVGGTRRNGGGSRRASSLSMSSSMFRRRGVDDDRRTTAGSSLEDVSLREDRRDGVRSCPTNASIANDDDRLERSSSFPTTTMRGRGSSSSSSITSDITSDGVIVEAPRATGLGDGKNEGIRIGNEDNGGDDGVAIQTREHADWYDPDELARMETKASSSAHDDDDDGGGANSYAVGDARTEKSRRGGVGGRRGGSATAGINDNFVRLDMRNSAGSCRGARNLKRANKHKLWRAQHRFGMSDNAQPPDRTGGTTNDGDGDDDVDGDGGGIGGSIHRGKERTRYNSTGKGDGGDLKCFSSAKNAGVDPLDDFVDGTYSSTKTKNVKGRDASAPRTRDEGVPICTRHQRPCKLLMVKRNNKGNKGRKFYVCCMPKGEQCDYFKWEEDTLEAAQRALLESSSNSGFIARQVAAAKLRFRELTVPELRIEAKGRGIKGTGKKNDILTRLLIWVRDEIAYSVESVESSSPRQEMPCSAESRAIADNNIVDDDDDSVEVSDDENESTDVAPLTTKMIELSDDESSSEYSSDGEETNDSELEICQEVTGTTRPRRSTVQSASTLHDSLENHFGYTEFRDGQEWAIRRVLAHERTLLVAPTGQGKSLCYALPAAIMDGICLVVSPLISLMQDQLRQLPPKIPAATLSGSMTVAQMALIVDDVMRNRYKVLFVSPERLASAAFRRLVRPKFNVETRKFERQFPVVSLLCVDEVSFFSFFVALDII
jgi:hypothetical protein